MTASRCRLMRVLILLALSTSSWAACPEVPRGWHPEKIYDNSCHLFEKIHTKGLTYISYRGKLELLDCSRAIHLMPENTWEFRSNLVNAEFFCGGKIYGGKVAGGLRRDIGQIR